MFNILGEGEVNSLDTLTIEGLFILVFFKHNDDICIKVEGEWVHG